MFPNAEPPTHAKGRRSAAAALALANQPTPQAYSPIVLAGFVRAVEFALIVIIASEMIGGVAGLGYMVLTAQQTFRVDRVFAGVVVIGMLGFATDQALRALRRKLLPWYVESRE